MHSCNEGDIDVSTRVWAAPGDVGSVVIHEYYFIFLIKKKKKYSNYLNSTFILDVENWVRDEHQRQTDVVTWTELR